MKKKNTLLAIIAVLLIIIAVLLVKQMKSQEEEPVGQGVVIEASGDVAKGYIGTTLPEISIPGRTVIELAAGVTETEIALHNTEDNTDYYDLSFTLLIKETGETVFSTGLIPPGYQCSRVTLTEALEKGEYDAILLVQPYLKDENHTPVNNAELSILLIVN